MRTTADAAQDYLNARNPPVARVGRGATPDDALAASLAREREADRAVRQLLALFAAEQRARRQWQAATCGMALLSVFVWFVLK